MSRTLVRDGVVLTLDPAIGELRRGDVLIDDGTIVAVENRIDPPAGAEIVDATGGIVMSSRGDRASSSAPSTVPVCSVSPTWWAPSPRASARTSSSSTVSPPTLSPVHDLTMSVVNSSGPGAVRTVIIDGEILKRDGQLTRYDSANVSRELGDLMARLWQQS